MNHSGSQKVARFLWGLGIQGQRVGIISLQVLLHSSLVPSRTLSYVTLYFNFSPFLSFQIYPPAAPCIKCAWKKSVYLNFLICKMDILIIIAALLNSLCFCKGQKKMPKNTHHQKHHVNINNDCFSVTSGS